MSSQNTYVVLKGILQGFAVSQNFGNRMQNVVHSYTTVTHGNTRAIQHISTVNHCIREVVYHTSAEYIIFVTGRERINKIEGEVAAKDRAREITSASEQASESLTTLKDARDVAFDRKVADAHQGPGLTPAVIAIMEAKKAAHVAQLAAEKAHRDANEANVEADKECARCTSTTLTTDHSHIQR
jgi:hypothetical protein